MSHTIPRRQVLKAYCCDGRNRKPEELSQDCVHEIRLPGGVLFPDLCAHSLTVCEQTFEMSEDPMEIEIKNKIKSLIPITTTESAFLIGEIILLFAFQVMQRLKEPKEIILGYHTHCGAAEAIGLTEEQVLIKMLDWQKRLTAMFPGIKIRILKEAYSICGESHFGHTELAYAA